MSAPVIETTAAALVAGLVTSIHCAGMCGPLTCAALPRPSAAYHAGRLLSYGAIGAACGALGERPLAWLSDSPLSVLPWFLVAVLLAMGLGIKARLPRPWFIQRAYARWRLLAGQRPVWQRGAVIGVMTPLLPCGPLYLMFGACLLTGSAVKGLEFALAFALGTIPLLWLAHGSWRRLSLKVSPMSLARIQRGLAFAAAAVLVWRLRGTLGFGPDGMTGCGCGLDA
ncbi:MAG: sulfite exporter TauE/SafE family protein [Verrucomicrobiales bacterium]